MGTGERVHDVAVRLFADRGFHGVGIRDLADAAGVSTATLYHYMGTKQDLLTAVMRTSLERLLGEAQQVAEVATDPRSAVADLVRLHVREHATRPLETVVVDGEMRALQDPQRAAVLELRRRYEAIWERALADGVHSGAFTVPDPAIARLAVLEMCTGVSRWFDAGGRLTPDQLAETYVEMVMTMLGATPPSRAR